MSTSWKFVGAETSVENNATSEVSLTLMLWLSMHLVIVQLLLQRSYLLNVAYSLMSLDCDCVQSQTKKLYV